jgi:F-type H+-transporting ATPase subunit a
MTFLNSGINMGNNAYEVLFIPENTSPLDQFLIREILSVDSPLFGDLHFSITTIGLYLVIGAFILSVINLLSTNYNKLVSNN